MIKRLTFALLLALVAFSSATTVAWADPDSEDSIYGPDSIQAP